MRREALMILVMTGASFVRQLFTRDVGIGSRSQLLSDLEMISVITSSFRHGFQFTQLDALKKTENGRTGMF